MSVAGQMTALDSILGRVVDHVRRYVVLTNDQLIAIALWIAHTHALGAAEATPYLNISSAEKESGKTLLLEVMRALVARPWLTGRVSAAVLARKVDDISPTLLLDESDAAFNGDKEYGETLRGILNTGYRRGGSYSVCVGQGANLTYRDFSTFAPKGIAGLGRLPDTVESRSISIRLKRRAPNEQIERYRERDVRPRAELVFNNLETWADHEPTIEALAEARPDLPENLGDRSCDVWEPLLAIADAAGGEWPQRARQAAASLSAPTDADDTLGVRLLADIRSALDDVDELTTQDLLTVLNALDEAPWGAWNDGAGMRPRELANKLRPYEIRSGDVHVDQDGKRKTLKGYRRADFEDAWERYSSGIWDSKRAKRANGSTKPKTAPSQARQEPRAARIENPAKPHGYADGADGADRTPDRSGNGRPVELVLDYRSGELADPADLPPAAEVEAKARELGFSIYDDGEA